MPPTNGNGNSGVWWIELLRREGVLVALIAGYAYFCLIPESQDRRKVLATQAATAAKIETAVARIATLEEEQQRDIQKAQVEHQKIIRNTETIIRATTRREPEPNSGG